jgi:hypothetical protein
MPIGLPLLGGFLVIAVLAVFVVVLYRMAGIRMTPLERRRWTVNFAAFSMFTMFLAFVGALEIPPGVWAYGLGFAVAGYLGVQQLQRNGHWLVTPTAEERAMLPARREALAAATRRPAFWVLVVGLVFFVPILGISLVLALR